MPRLQDEARDSVRAGGGKGIPPRVVKMPHGIMEVWKDYPTKRRVALQQRFDDEGLEDRKVHLPLPNLMLPLAKGSFRIWSLWIVRLGFVSEVTAMTLTVVTSTW